MFEGVGGVTWETRGYVYVKERQEINIWPNEIDPPWLGALERLCLLTGAIIRMRLDKEGAQKDSLYDTTIVII